MSYVSIGYLLKNPFKIIEELENGTGNVRYKIVNITTNKLISCQFKTIEAAANQIDNWLRFRQLLCNSKKNG